VIAPALRHAKELPRPPSERGVEYHYALGQILGLPGARTILDVGPGKSPWPALLATSGYEVTAIDNATDYWGSGGFFNYHWPIQKQDITRPTLSPDRASAGVM